MRGDMDSVASRGKAACEPGHALLDLEVVCKREVTASDETAPQPQRPLRA